MFTPNSKFKKEYNKIYDSEPYMANLFLLLCELANEKGEVEITVDELFILSKARFNDPDEYAL